MRIGLVQFDIHWENKDKNFSKVESLIEKGKNYDLIVLPEMFNTGFSLNPLLAEERGGKTERFLSELASSLKTYVLAGYTLKINEKLKNVATLFSKEGKIESSYTKIHLFSPLAEDQYFVDGQMPVIFYINDIPCSVFICYDLRFPEIFRIISHKVKVIFVIANWPSSRVEHWITLLKARAIENQVYIVGVNRVGNDGNGIFYSGKSAVFSPWGENLLIADDQERFIDFFLDISYLDEIRKKYSFLKDAKLNYFFKGFNDLGIE